MKLHNVTLGADPELFLYNTQTQQLVSAIGKIPGSKTQPFKPQDLSNGYGLQTDNVLVEFNVPPTPLADKATFINNLLNMRQYINQYVKQLNDNYTTQAIASGYLPSDELTSDEAFVFGCDPDFNCYTQTVNCKPQLKDINFRTAGFHIHVGYDNPNVRDSVTLIKYLDLFVGVPSILVDPDTERRSLYGKAGCYRLQPWGVEYRSLSAFFMSNAATLEFVYNQVNKAIQAFEENIKLPAATLVTKAINENNYKIANRLIQKFNIV